MGASRPTARRSTWAPAAASGGVELAKRGWQVTRVDIVEKALQRARERIEKEGVEIRVVHADLTTLRDAGVGEDFRLLGVADAASARYGWPLHAIEHCGVDPHVEQPDAFLDALRAELDGGSPVRKRKRS